MSDIIGSTVLVIIRTVCVVEILDKIYGLKANNLELHGLNCCFVRS